MKISIEQYVALNNPKAAKQFLEKFGFEPARSLEDLIHKVESATLHYRQDALEELGSIDTPYRRLILSTIEEDSESKSNCSGGCSCSKSNVEGESKTSDARVAIIPEPDKVTEKEVATTKNLKVESVDKTDKYMPYVLGFAGLAAIVILAKIKI